MGRYTYGDSDLAAERLRLVAAMFEPTSSAFVRKAGRPGLAIDLGCGPGHSIAMVGEATGSRAVGVERSSAFARVARAAGHEVVVADVLAPLPIDGADVVYARLLLAHLPDPASVVARWSTILTIGGRVLIDDLEQIETDEPVFRAYLDEVALEVVRRQGGALFVGPELHRTPDPESLERTHDAVTTFTPAASVTARVFAMNLVVLTERGETAPRPSLAVALDAIAEGRRDAEAVRWHIRQLAWERTG